MKRENKMGRKAVDFGVPVLIATILIFSSVITIAADERGPAAYIVDGYAVYCNGGNADGATVLLTPSSGSSVTTTVGPAGGWPTGYWQINVGSIGGPGWEYGTTFSVLITTSGWSGSQSGFTIVDDGNYHTYTGTTTLNPTTSVVATASAYPTTIVEGESVDFTGSATGGTGVYTWYWDFDGDGTSAEQNPSHTFNDEGTYVCTLTATDECSNSDDDTVTITVNPALSCDAGGPYSGDVCDPVSFTGSASGGYSPYTYDWDFGDGSSHSSQQNPTHQYVNDGSYTATLTVTDSNTNTDTDTAPVTISTDPLVADAGGPYSGTMCDPVSFTGSASGGCDPYTYDWDFGDGSSHSSQQNPTHQYVNDGSYTATLTVTDSNTNTDTDTAPVTISTDPLVADAGGPYSGTMCDPVSFTGSASGGCDPYTYDWDFGDGSSGSGLYPSHQYDNDGTYTATLTVTDDVGLTDQDTAQVTISTPVLSCDAGGPYEGNPVSFTGSASGGCDPYTYDWDFGDGGTGTGSSPSHVYATGMYTATLTVTDDVGQMTSCTATVWINNTAPQFGTPIPGDGDMDQPVEYLTWMISISDLEGDRFDWSIECSNGQSVSGFNDADGLKEIYLGGLEYNIEYTVWVNATDEEGGATREVYTFTTADQPSIVMVDDDYSYETSGFGIDHFIGIQHGVDHVKPGGTVEVSDGHYSEPSDIIIDTEGIDVKGPDSSSFSYSEAVIDDNVVINADHVSFSGFVLQPSKGTPALRITSNADAETIKINHNKFLRECVSNAIGIENQDTNNLDARYNWWGAPDGPSGLVIDPITVRKADGFGVKIVDNGPIMFDPWAGLDAKADDKYISATSGTSIEFDASQSFACHLDGTPNDFTVLWDFDDGTYSTNMQTNHVFNTPGTYDVSLRVEAIDSQLHSGFMYDWYNITVNIFEEGTPLACNADGENLGGYNGMRNTLIQFYGTVVGGTPPYTYQWSFDDNTGTVTGQNPTHKYTNAGTYTVSLTVVDNSGGIATDTADVTVNDVEPLEVEISESTSNPKVGETVSFTGNVDGGLTPYTYTWDFGDNTQPVNSKNTEHTYNTEGTYTVALTVTDHEETIATDTATITVTSESDVEEVEILDVKAGYLLSATIKAGDNPVDWTINVDGFVFMGGSASGTITAGAIQTVKLPFSLGLGNVDITVTANSVTKEATAFMLGPFVLSVEEI